MSIVVLKEEGNQFGTGSPSPLLSMNEYPISRAWSDVHFERLRDFSIRYKTLCG